MDGDLGFGMCDWEGKVGEGIVGEDRDCLAGF